MQVIWLWNTGIVKFWLLNYCTKRHNSSNKSLNLWNLVSKCSILASIYFSFGVKILAFWCQNTYVLVSKCLYFCQNICILALKYLHFSVNISAFQHLTKFWQKMLAFALFQSVSMYSGVFITPLGLFCWDLWNLCLSK